MIDLQTISDHQLEQEYLATNVKLQHLLTKAWDEMSTYNNPDQPGIERWGITGMSRANEAITAANIQIYLIEGIVNEIERRNNA